MTTATVRSSAEVAGDGGWGRFLDAVLAGKAMEETKREPTRISLNITLHPSTVQAIDDLGRQMSETRRGRIIDMIVAEREQLEADKKDKKKKEEGEGK